MRKLLILGASIAQVPFVKTAKNMGLQVGIVDYNKNAPAIEFCDDYFECSLLDYDGIEKITIDYKPDGITCGASDIGVINCAKVCNSLRLPSMDIEVSYLVKDKEKMIQAFELNNVAHPKYQVLDGYSDDISIPFPVIVKPIDSSGSRGINVANNMNDLKLAIEDSLLYSADKKVIIEEYMDGPEVSVEILIQDFVPYVLQVTDKLTSGEPHFIEIGHSQPSLLPQNDVEAIKKLAMGAVKAVKIKDGCAHAEIKLTKSGPKMVEIAGRLGGDFITTYLLPISTGINLAEYEILRALGTPKKFDGIIKTNRGSAVRFIQAKKGTIKSVSMDCISNAMIGIEEIKFVCEYGVRYTSIENNNDRFGYVIASGKSAEIAIERCENMLKHIKIEMC